MALFYNSDFMMHDDDFGNTLTASPFETYDSEFGVVPASVPQLSVDPAFMSPSSFGDFTALPYVVDRANIRREEPFVSVPGEPWSLGTGGPLSADMDITSPYAPCAEQPNFRKGSPFNTTSSSHSGSSRYSPKLPTRQSTFFGEVGSFPSLYVQTSPLKDLSLPTYHSNSNWAHVNPIQIFPKEAMEVDSTGFEAPAVLINALPNARAVEQTLVRGGILTPTIGGGDDDDAEGDIDDEDEAVIEIAAHPAREHSPCDSDSDYIPSKGASPKRSRHQKSFAAEKTHATTRSKVGKAHTPRRSSVGGGRGAKAAAGSTRHRHSQSSGDSSGEDDRPFSCPLEPYGCEETFRSKNEWKRHITTQHLAKSYWDCDQCRDKPNLFNRKDLFTQHLRRMHHPLKEMLDAEGLETPKRKPKKSTASDGKSTAGDGKKSKKATRELTPEEKKTDLEFEEKLEEHRVRCERRKRTPPAKMVCAFCMQEFCGDKNCDDWMEHLGAHLAKESPNEHGHRPQLKNDVSFRDWLIDNEIVTPVKGATNEWVLVSKKTQAYSVDENTMEK